MSTLLDKTILIVDDDEILREVYMEEFQLLGARVTASSSGNKAIALIKTSPVFDLIITDVQMPDGDGSKLLAFLRTTFLETKPPIIMISGFTDLPKEELLKQGADHVLAKPFELQDLIQISGTLCLNNRTNQIKGNAV